MLDFQPAFPFQAPEGSDTQTLVSKARISLLHFLLLSIPARGQGIFKNGVPAFPERPPGSVPLAKPSSQRQPSFRSRCGLYLHSASPCCPQTGKTQGLVGGTPKDLGDGHRSEVQVGVGVPEAELQKLKQGRICSQHCPKQCPKQWSDSSSRRRSTLSPHPCPSLYFWDSKGPSVQARFLCDF